MSIVLNSTFDRNELWQKSRTHDLAKLLEYQLECGFLNYLPISWPVPFFLHQSLVDALPKPLNFYSESRELTLPGF